jgi:hypothetical protein
MEIFKLPGYNPPPMHVNPKIQLRKRRTAEFELSAGPQTKLRTDRKLPVLYYISYGYVFPHTNHHSKKSARAVMDSIRVVMFPKSFKGSSCAKVATITQILSSSTCMNPAPPTS